MEDKQKILDLLLPALQATRKYNDLMSLEYRIDTERKRELVVAGFANGYSKSADVTADSGIAMLYDIIAQIA